MQSPPLSPQSNNSHNSRRSSGDGDSDSYSNHSYSNGTTGQQHKLNDIALPSTYYNSEYGGDNNTKNKTADLFMDGIPEFEFTVDNLELHNKKIAEETDIQKLLNEKNKKLQLTLGSGSSASAARVFHHHQHQHFHHHHHAMHTAAYNNGYSTNSGYSNSKTNNYSQLSHLSQASVQSTDSQHISRIFHPGNRLQFSKFKNKTKENKNKPNLNPESQYSTAAALDPLDELDNMDVLNNYDKHKELGNGTDAFVYEVVDSRD
eukprot:297485_1